MEGGSNLTPVYVPYATLQTALKNLRTNGIPGTGKVDKTIWDRMSGSAQTQIIVAFRFLGLIDEANKVLPSLEQLVQAENEDEEKQRLRKIIEERYAPVLARDLRTITSGQLEEAFREFKIQGSTLDRAIRFFVKACQELGIPINNRIADKTRKGSTAPRRKRGSSQRQDDLPQREQTNTGQSPINASVSWEQRLLDKFPTFDPSWPDELKAQWFAGFDRLMNAKGG